MNNILYQINNTFGTQTISFRMPEKILSLIMVFIQTIQQSNPLPIANHIAIYLFLHSMPIFQHQWRTKQTISFSKELWTCQIYITVLPGQTISPKRLQDRKHNKVRSENQKSHNAQGKKPLFFSRFPKNPLDSETFHWSMTSWKALPSITQSRDSNIWKAE